MLVRFFHIFRRRKTVMFQNRKQSNGCKIDYAEALLDEFSGNAVGEEGVSHSRVPVEADVFETGRKIQDKFPGAGESPGGGLPGGKAAGRAYQIFSVVVQAEMIKIFFFEYLLEIGLGVQQGDLCPAETAAFLAVDKSGIPAYRAVIAQFQEIFRKS